MAANLVGRQEAIGVKRRTADFGEAVSEASSACGARHFRPLSQSHLSVSAAQRFAFA
jgi:hypothetical protein